MIKNTFWTIIDNKYYRIHNSTLRDAPVGNNNTVLTAKVSTVTKMNDVLLHKINHEFGSSFIIENFS